MSLPNYMYFEEICEHALDIVHEHGYFFDMANEFCKRDKTSIHNRPTMYRFSKQDKGNSSSKKGKKSLKVFII